MRKLTNQLYVMVFACFIGITFAVTWSSGQCLIKEASISNQTVTESRSNRKILKEWKKIDVGDNVSFYLPPKFTNTGLPGNTGVVAAFERKVSNGVDFYLNYAYGESVPLDANPHQGRRNKIMISGKRAYLNIWEQSFDGFRREPSGMNLFIPDVNIGENKFELYMVGSDLELMKQIIDCVEIH